MKMGVGPRLGLDFVIKGYPHHLQHHIKDILDEQA